MLNQSQDGIHMRAISKARGVRRGFGLVVRVAGGGVVVDVRLLGVRGVLVGVVVVVAVGQRAVVVLVRVPVRPVLELGQGARQAARVVVGHVVVVVRVGDRRVGVGRGLALAL